MTFCNTTERPKLQGKNAIYIVAFFTALLVALPGLWPQAVVIQLFALVPFFVFCRYNSPKKAALCGAWTGFALGLFMCLIALLSTSFMLIFGLWFALVWALAGYGCAQALQRLSVGSLWGCGAVFALCEYINITVLPLWGTAQLFVRPWTHVPELIAFVGITGVLGLVFVVVAANAALAAYIGCRRCSTAFVAFAGLFVVAGIGNAVMQSRTTDGTIKVAAYGEAEIGDFKLAPANAAKAINLAHKANAQLLVLPETGFGTAEAALQTKTVQSLQTKLATTPLTLVFGWLTTPERKNQLIAINSQTDFGRYNKTRAVPLMENIAKGDGTAFVFTPAKGLPTLGGLICQDDNFTDLASNVRQSGANILAVPTNDWAAVRKLHLQNTVFRALEHRMPIVRGAFGISAIINRNGKILTQRDHVTTGAGTIAALVEYETAPTPFTRFGHWPVLLLSTLGLIILLGRQSV